MQKIKQWALITCCGIATAFYGESKAMHFSRCCLAPLLNNTKIEDPTAAKNNANAAVLSHAIKRRWPLSAKLTTCGLTVFSGNTGRN